MIGLHSAKGLEWANMGRSFIRGILNSSRGISEKDNSQQAMMARRINGFADLDGIEFLAKIDVEKDQHGEDKNAIKFVITPDHKEYQGYVNGGGTSQATHTQTGGFQPGAQRPAQGGNAGFQPGAQQSAPAANAGFQPGQQTNPSANQPGQNPGSIERPQWAQ